MSKPIKLNKVPLASLIQALTHLYEEGADFIDIAGESTPESDNDVIKVTVRPEYYSDDDDYDDDEEIEPNKEDINPISDDDINDLI